jgi:hypothetical protein
MAGFGNALDSSVCLAGLARQFMVIHAPGMGRALGPALVFAPPGGTLPSSLRHRHRHHADADGLGQTQHDEAAPL